MSVRQAWRIDWQSTLAGKRCWSVPKTTPFLNTSTVTPMLRRFPRSYIFQRSRQLETLQQRELFSDGLVADFMFAKDRLFAQLNLGKAELALYEEVYSRLSMDAPVPDLVVYLQAPVDVLLQRIRRRARPQESTLSADYLARVNGAYTRFFYRYDDAPVLIVNAESINPIDNDSDFNALVEHIRRPRPGRSYFNPSPLAIN